MMPPVDGLVSSDEATARAAFDAFLEWIHEGEDEVDAAMLSTISKAAIDAPSPPTFALEVLLLMLAYDDDTMILTFDAGESRWAYSGEMGILADIAAALERHPPLGAPEAWRMT